MANNKGINTSSLNVGYGKRIVIKEVTLDVMPGKILTLIGPNGSGKSTVLKSITKQLKLLGGNVYVDGKSINELKNDELAKKISMVMTERIKTEMMTCRDVVATGRYPYTGKMGILSKEDFQKVDASMAMVNATETANIDFNKVSDGQRQRVMLARAICQDTDILILDEPTSYLDMKYKIEILSNIRRLAIEKNLAVIMSLHELELAQKISDYIACVDGDSIGRIGTPEEIFTDNYIQKLYGIDDECFDPITGMVHFKTDFSNENEETKINESNGVKLKYFVIGGAGKAISLYHRLQRENTPFAAGIIYENDIEYGVARASAVEMIYEKAFCEVKRQKLERAKKLIDLCEECICVNEEFGVYNTANKELFEYAKKLGKIKRGN